MRRGRRLLDFAAPKGDHSYFLWVGQEALQAARGKRSNPLFLAPDQAVSWLLKQAREAVLYLAVADCDGEGTYLDQIVVNEGCIAEYTQRVLPASSSPSWDEELVSLLLTEKTRLGRRPVYFAGNAPLPKDARLRFVEDVGESPFKRLVHLPIERGYRYVNLREAVVPALIVTAGLAVFGGVHAYGHQRLTSLHEEFREEVDPVKQEYQKKEQSLRLLQSREDFLDKRSTDDKAAAMRRILSAFAGMDDLLVQRLEVSSFRDTDLGVAARTEYRFDVKVAAVPDESVSAIEQIEPVMRKVSQRLGARVQLTKHNSGQISRISRRKTFRMYEIEGRYEEDGS